MTMTKLLHFCLTFIVFSEIFAQEDNSPCINDDSSAGICRRMNQCPYGLKQLRTMGQHTLHRCGFDDIDEVVCCPQSSTSTTEPSKIGRKTTPEPFPRQGLVRKSVSECEKLVNRSETRISWHIINGIDADPGEFPHMAALGYPKDEGGIGWDCGASLISSRFLITAAHCIVKVDGIKPTKVRMGEIDLTNEESLTKQDFNVVDTIVNKEYNIAGRLNDIALVKIDRDPIINKFVTPACLYTTNTVPSKGLIITGWGVINSNLDNSENALQKATISSSSLQKCRQLYRERVNKVITEKQICAVDPSKESTKDSCSGDSGGPLQVENFNDSSIYSIVGITSYGMGCGTTLPSVYTRVSQYLDWIENNVWPG